MLKVGFLVNFLDLLIIDTQKKLGLIDIVNHIYNYINI